MLDPSFVADVTAAGGTTPSLSPSHGSLKTIETGVSFPEADDYDSPPPAPYTSSPSPTSSLKKGRFHSTPRPASDSVDEAISYEDNVLFNPMAAPRSVRSSMKKSPTKSAKFTDETAFTHATSSSSNNSRSSVKFASPPSPSNSVKFATAGSPPTIELTTFTPDRSRRPTNLGDGFGDVPLTINVDRDRGDTNASWSSRGSTASMWSRDSRGHSISSRDSRGHSIWFQDHEHGPTRDSRGMSIRMRGMTVAEELLDDIVYLFKDKSDLTLLQRVAIYSVRFFFIVLLVGIGMLVAWASGGLAAPPAPPPDSDVLTGVGGDITLAEMEVLLANCTCPNDKNFLSEILGGRKVAVEVTGDIYLTGLEASVRVVADVPTVSVTGGYIKSRMYDFEMEIQVSRPHTYERTNERTNASLSLLAATPPLPPPLLWLTPRLWQPMKFRPVLDPELCGTKSYKIDGVLTKDVPLFEPGGRNITNFECTLAEGAVAIMYVNPNVKEGSTKPENIQDGAGRKLHTSPAHRSLGRLPPGSRRRLNETVPDLPPPDYITQENPYTMVSFIVTGEAS